MVSFKQAAEGELDLLKAFAQKEFNENNFAEILPKLYSNNAKSEALHTILYDDNEIQGMFALQIKSFNIANINVRVGWLGTVCVKSDARGNGYLAQIMNYASQLLKNNNCDIGVLGGQRQRYKRFGYEYGGSQWVLTLTDRNLRDVNADNISLQVLNSHSEWLELAYDLYCKDYINGARTKRNFCTILSSWQSQPFAILNEGVFTGYCTLHQDKNHGQIYEMRLTDAKLTLNACKAISSYCLKKDIVIFQCLWADNTVTELLSQECESAQLRENHSYNVINWQKIILAGLKLKALCNVQLQEATCFIQIHGYGIVRVSVDKDKQINVEYLIECEHVHASLSQEQAVRLLLGHTALTNNKSLLMNWFAVPLGFSWLDGI